MLHMPGHAAPSFRMALNRVQWAGLLAALVAGAVLGIALLSESYGGLVPCALCLWERWPYRIAALFGVLALVSPRSARLCVALAAFTLLAGAGLGALHVGVEQGWWPSPLPECAAPSLGGGTMAERLARMPARPAKPCDEPVFLVPGLPVSMAAMNLVVATGLGLSLFAALRARRTS